MRDVSAPAHPSEVTSRGQRRSARLHLCLVLLTPPPPPPGMRSFPRSAAQCIEC